MKTKVDLLLNKLVKHPVNNDKEFLECLIDLDYRLKILEDLHNTNDNCYGESVKKCIWYKNYEKYGEDFNQLGIGAGENLEKKLKGGNKTKWEK